jgi:hypothetical protein
MLPNPIAGYDIDTQLLGSSTIKDASGNIMFKGQLFPYIYTDGTNEAARTFVLVDDTVPRTEKGFFKNVNIYIYVFTHKSLIKLIGKEAHKYELKEYKGNCRTDILSTAIDNILNKNKVFGIRELKLESVDTYKPSADYYGRVLKYSATCENIGGDRCG